MEVKKQWAPGNWEVLTRSQKERGVWESKLVKFFVKSCAHP